ncbi:hypothetical protein NP493_600g04015 [Ridgeia piscesae]|uniref:Alpha-L-arabinofuranosidase B arabinose-binding domain-containing protein n=1 Tax=Ridgeia piscesae TaxID=27915 RepID=A0AAD9KU53_RIDPI|nr:hypothetical protein NP493_600g04015 [Ridgeia piscesae]
MVLLNYAQRKYISLDGDAAVINDAPMKSHLVRPGLTKAANTVSIMSSEKPGWYLRHSDSRLYLAKLSETDLFYKDATFTEHTDSFYMGFTSFQSVNVPDMYVSINDKKELFIRKFQDTKAFKESASFSNGVERVLYNHLHRGFVSLNGDAAIVSKMEVTFYLVRPGLTKAANTVSIMSSEKPGWYLRHSDSRLYLVKRSETDLFYKDATFTEHTDSFYIGFTSFQSVNVPDMYVSTNDKKELFIRKFQDTKAFKESASFSNGVERVLYNHLHRGFVSLNGDAAIVSKTEVTFYLIRPGLTKAANTVSIMSSEKPGWYLRHSDSRLYLAKLSETDLFYKDATFTEHTDSFYIGFTSFQSVNVPDMYVSTNDKKELFIRKFQDTKAFKESASFSNGVERVLYNHLHRGFVSLNGDAAIVSKMEVTFYLVRPGLTKAANTVSIMSSEKPGWYLRHSDSRLYLVKRSETDLFYKDATFTEHTDSFYIGFTSFQSVNVPDMYVSTNDKKELFIRKFQDTKAFKRASFATVSNESLQSATSRFVSLNGDAAIVSKMEVTFYLVRPGLTKAANTVSIMSSEKPGWYLRHSDSRLYLVKRSETDLFYKDATFTEHTDSFYIGFTSFQSVNVPDMYVSTNDKKELFIRKFQDTKAFKESASFSNGVERVLYNHLHRGFVSLNGDAAIRLPIVLGKRSETDLFYKDATFTEHTDSFYIGFTSFQSVNVPDMCRTSLYNHLHRGFVSLNGDAAIVSKMEVTFYLVRPGLTKAANTVSIMSSEKPGWYLRHSDSRLYLAKAETDLFYKDATFTEHTDSFYIGFTSFQSVNVPDIDSRLYLAKLSETDLFYKDATFTEHTDSFYIGFTSFQSVNVPDMYVSTNDKKELFIRKFQDTEPFKESASFSNGLTKAANTVSIMSSEKPGWYLRHSDSRLYLVKRSETDLFYKDATFTEHTDSFYIGFTSFQSVNVPDMYVSTNDKKELFIRKFQDTKAFKESASFSNGLMKKAQKMRNDQTGM